MPWVRLDDAIGENPKMAQLPGEAFALYICGLAYCNRNLTDGFIPNHVGLGQLRFCDGNPVPMIRELEAGGLWEKVRGGWQIHDYGEYQPSKQQVEEERSKKQAAGQAGGQASARARARPQARNEAEPQAPAQAESKPVPVPVPVPQKAALDLADELPIFDWNGHDDREVYFLERLQRIDGTWFVVNPVNLAELNNSYGTENVRTALEHAHEEQLVPMSPLAWLRKAAKASA